MNRLFHAIAAAAVSFPSAAGGETLLSPDGKIRVEVTTAISGSPAYSVFVDDAELLAPSRLGFATKDSVISFNGSFSTVRDSCNNVWTQQWGENKTNLCHYNEMVLSSQGQQGLVVIRFRAFNDGIAFRYEWDLTDKSEVVINDELTEFNLAQKADSWSIPADFDSYEHKYRHMPVEKVMDANTPFTFHIDSGIFGSIHEAALYDYPEMTLRRAGSDSPFKADLAPWSDGVKAYVLSSFTTPWRTVQIGRKAVDLINSALILNLNENPKIKDPSLMDYAS